MVKGELSDLLIERMGLALIVLWMADLVLCQAFLLEHVMIESLKMQERMQLLFAFAAMVLAYTHFPSRSILFALLAIAVAVFDNLFGIHSYLTPALKFLPGPEHWSDLVIGKAWAGGSVALLMVGFLFLSRGLVTSRFEQRIVNAGFIYVSTLISCGVFFDLLIANGPPTRLMLSLEEGLELLAVSFLATKCLSAATMDVPGQDNVGYDQSYV